MRCDWLGVDPVTSSDRCRYGVEECVRVCLRSERRRADVSATIVPIASLIPTAGEASHVPEVPAARGHAAQTSPLFARVAFTSASNVATKVPSTSVDGESRWSAPAKLQASRVEDTRLSDACMATAHRSCWLDPLLVEPKVEFSRIEPDEAPDLEERDPSLGHHPLHVSPRDTQSLGHGVDVEQWRYGSAHG